MVNQKESSQLFDSLLFPKLFQSFRIAIQPSKLVIAFLAVVIIWSAGWLMDTIGSSTSDIETGVFYTLLSTAAERFHGALESLFALDMPGVIGNICLCSAIFSEVLNEHYIFCIIFSVIKLAIISLAGGAICRIAALQFARGEKPGISEAIRFSTKKFTSLFSAPLAAIVIIIFIGFFIFLLGFVGNIPWAGKPIMVIFMILALIAGGLITIVLIGLVAGFNLMFPAVAYDDSDCFDAISRSFSYIFAKPWRMAFYTAIAAIYGAICYMFVRFFAFVMLWTTRWFLKIGVLGDNSKLTEIWHDDPTFAHLVVPPNWESLNAPASFAAFLVYLLLLAVVALVAAYIVSFYFSANTIIYALMRKAVDNTALNEVYTPTDEGKNKHAINEAESKENQSESKS